MCCTSIAQILIFYDGKSLQDIPCYVTLFASIQN